MSLDTASQRCRFRVTLAPNQERLFPRAGPRAIEVEKPSNEARDWNLATTILGAHDPRRRGLRASHGLHPFQSGEARLAIQQFQRYVNNGSLPPDWGGDVGEIRVQFGE